MALTKHPYRGETNGSCHGQGIVGSRRVAMPSTALTSLDNGHGSSIAERNQAGISLLGGAGVDCTLRIS